MKLTTKYERYQMGTSTIAVPTRFSRTELSKLVNEALELEKPIPFDFIIDGVLLRVPLSEYISLHGLSLETTLVLEYVPIIGKPEEKSSEDLPDWIGGLSSIEDYYVAGCYDGSVHLYNAEDSLVASTVAHKRPIKSVDLHKQQDDLLVASTSLDNTIRLLKLSENALQPFATLSGHDSHVLCCKFDPASSLLVTGAWNGSILVWDVSTVSPSSSKEVEPVHTLSEGVAGVTALGWSQNRVVSGGWDQTLRVWDLEMEGVVSDMVCARRACDVERKQGDQRAGRAGGVAAGGHGASRRRGAAVGRAAWGRRGSLRRRGEAERADVRLAEAVRLGGAVAPGAAVDRGDDGLRGERDAVRSAVGVPDPHRGARAEREDSGRGVEERGDAAERRGGQEAEEIVGGARGGGRCGLGRSGVRCLLETGSGAMSPIE